MDIYYLGHSSFRIKGKSASLVTDPFDPKMVGLKFAGVTADIVTISHDHGDHNQYQLVSGVVKVVNAPGEYEIMGVSIIGIPSYHDEVSGSKRGKNTIYVFEMDDMRVCHLGDLGHALSESLIEEIGDIDILMVPVGGEYTIDSETAAKVVQDIEPSIIIPMHFAGARLNPEVFSKLEPVDNFVKALGLPSESLPKLSVKKEDIGEEQKVVILVAK